MSVDVESPPLPPPTKVAPPRQEEPLGSRKGGWFVRIAILAIIVLWLIPTIGVLVTSFRPEGLVDTTGWWTALAHPFRAGEWTFENYTAALDSGGFGNAFLNSLAVTIPSTVIPITIPRSPRTPSPGWSSGVATSCSWPWSGCSSSRCRWP
jgi:alpha-glucoside transport system permease protein